MTQRSDRNALLAQRLQTERDAAVDALAEPDSTPRMLPG